MKCTELPIRLSQRKLLAAMFIGSLLTHCTDGILNTSLLDSTAETSEPPDSSSEQVPSNIISGTVWERCAVGQTYDETTNTCLGEKAEILCQEVGDACPEGTVLPSRKDFENLLCGNNGGMDDVCPNDRYFSCADCAQCSALFGDDTGIYPVREHIVEEYVSTEYYIGYLVFFSTGCATDDGYSDTLCNVRCIQTPETICGDGIVIDTEECDDANALSGDGCSEACLIEDGYACPEPGEPCVQV